MSFTPHIDTSHFAQFSFSTNITIQPPPIPHIPVSNFSFTPIHLNIHQSLPVPNIQPSHVSNMKQSLNNIVPTSVDPKIESMKESFTLTVCTQTPYVRGCYSATVKGSKVDEKLSVCSSLPMVNGCVSTPVTEQIKKDVNIVNEHPM